MAEKPPMGTGTVGPVPDKPVRPKGYLWDQLDAAKNVDELTKLRDHAQRQGYSADGQLMTAIADKFSELRRKDA